jgi:hypothetical protein
MIWPGTGVHQERWEETEMKKLWVEGRDWRFLFTKSYKIEKLLLDGEKTYMCVCVKFLYTALYLYIIFLIKIF